MPSQTVRPSVVRRAVEAEHAAGCAEEGRAFFLAAKATLGDKKDVGQIVRANVLAPINLVVGVLAALVIVAGSPKNALFAGVIVANSVIGVVQELRAKRVLDRLSVVNAPRAHAIRDGSVTRDELFLQTKFTFQRGQDHRLPYDPRASFAPVSLVASAPMFVTINAKVVKVSSGIMNRNWIHIQDGTGDASTGTNNLVTTTLDVAEVGDVVTATGKLAKDKDFGGGYQYVVIIEETKLQGAGSLLALIDQRIDALKKKTTQEQLKADAEAKAAKAAAEVKAKADAAAAAAAGTAPAAATPPTPKPSSPAAAPAAAPAA